MTLSSRLALVVPLALAAVALAPVPALAQAHAPSAQELETARALYKEGKELRAQGNLRGARDLGMGTVFFTGADGEVAEIERLIGLSAT